MKSFTKAYHGLYGGWVYVRSRRMILYEPMPVMREAGRLAACTSLGGYPLVYLTLKGHPLCSACAEHAEDLRDRAIHFEGKPLKCAKCATQIESAYGDPWAKEN